MERFLDRPEKILIYLYCKSGKAKIDELAEHLQVGRSTIEKELHFLMEVLSNTNFFIKSGEAHLDIISPSLIEDALKILYKDNVFFKIIMLLFEKNIYSVNELTTILNMSKSTVYRKFKVIKEWLQEYKLTLVTTPVLTIQGDEKNIRNLMQQFYDFYLSRSLSEIRFFDKELFVKKIDEICVENNFNLTPQGLRKLSISMEIMHIRNRLSKYIQYKNFPTEENSLYINITKKLQSFFPNYMNKNIKQYEIIYYATNLYNYLIRKRKATIDEIYSVKDTNLRYSMIFDFLDNISENFYFNFSSDIRLVEGLSRYTELYYIDLRLGTNNRLNGLSGYINICKDHPFYALVKEAALKFFKQYNFLPEIKEIDIFALYYFLSISQLRIKKIQSVSIAIITESEIEQESISEYLTFKYGTNIQTYSLNLYAFKKNIFYQEYDLLINMENNNSLFEGVESLTISPILSNADKTKLDYKINELLNKKMTKYTELIVF
ncbi:hypothetical protein GY31_04035 [Lysinibacillus sphaericus]|uniref:helix-turn-helix domain-containing protein n=1 Tax=Lysinibacillus TaxID=400634 RepID=UPI00084BA561|nr:helix-turn-helix domain-containing protein [Lysinibacillus sphaericus]OEC03142.1 hypothetical protein GY31_04035 [Lysinibacillus sphaericus]